MANTIQIKRGLEADRSSVTPAAGELLYTTDGKQMFVGDGSTAGGNQVGGGGGAVLEATASGALANGDMVVVNSDGTVSVVASVSQSVGTPVLFNNASTSYNYATYDSTSQKVVIAYRDGGNLNYGTAVVGTVSGASISFGTPVVFESASTYYPSVAYDSVNEKVVIAYQDAGNSNRGTAIVGTVSGTSISFGSPTVFHTSSTLYVNCIYDSTAQKAVIAFRGLTNYGRAVVGTVSGTSISFGTAVVFNSAVSAFVSATYDSVNGKAVITYQNGGNSDLGTAIVGTVSGTSISFGTSVVFGGAVYETAPTYDSNSQKVVIAYVDKDNSEYGTAVVGTVSGTSISFGTPVVFESAITSYTKITYDSLNAKVVVVYRDEGNSNYGTLAVGTVSGTSISFGSPTVFENANSYDFAPIYDSAAQKVVIPYTDQGNSSRGTAVVFQNESTNLTASNFIGISDGAYADTATATIQVATSVDDAQTGLTAGSQYYVQTDGTLSTTPDSPSVLAGTAISATEIIVKG
jgi:hypothetical protein